MAEDSKSEQEKVPTDLEPLQAAMKKALDVLDGALPKGVGIVIIMTDNIGLTIGGNVKETSVRDLIKAAADGLGSED